MTLEDIQSKGVSPHNAYYSMLSEKQSDFDDFSAVGEVIDNSIQHGEASNIHIHLEYKHINPNTRGRPSYRITKIIMSDNGKGMDNNTLLNCLRLGWSGRYNDRNGMARFGVGMTKGAIRNCNKVNVYSKQKGSTWKMVKLSFPEWKAELEKDSNVEIKIKPPRDEELPDEIEQYSFTESGTIVIWDDIDFTAMTCKPNELFHWISRTYRKFISEKILSRDELAKPELIDNDNQISITVSVTGGTEHDTKNRITLKPHDPLYVIPCLEDDEPAELFQSIIHDIELTEDIDPELNFKELISSTSPIIIRMSLTPEHFRKKRKVYASDPINKKRHISPDKRDPGNIGISILRADREVYYGPWINANIELSGADREGKYNDRFWSCEISFEPNLDRAFSVKNIKVGAKPVTTPIINPPAMYDTDDEKISTADLFTSSLGPPIKECRNRIINCWNENECISDEDDEDTSDPVGAVQDAGHEEAEDAATRAGVGPDDEENELDDEDIQEVKEILEDFGFDVATSSSKEDLIALLNKWHNDDGPLRITNKKGNEYSPFVEFSFPGSMTILQYNNNSNFNVFIRDLINKLMEITGAEYNDINKYIQAIADIILMSFALAARDAIGRGKNPDVRDQMYRDLLRFWNNNLTDIISELNAIRKLDNKKIGEE